MAPGTWEALGWAKVSRWVRETHHAAMQTRRPLWCGVVWWKVSHTMQTKHPQVASLLGRREGRRKGREGGGEREDAHRLWK